MKLKSSEEFVKYLTERAVGYLSMPKAERKLKRYKVESWSYRWFGLIPLAMRLWRKK